MMTTRWDYFVLRRAENNYGEVIYYHGDSQNAVNQNTPEDKVLNAFGQHGYELVSVQTTRMGETKYFFKRPAKG